MQIISTLFGLFISGLPGFLISSRLTNDIEERLFLTGSLAPFFACLVAFPTLWFGYPARIGCLVSWLIVIFLLLTILRKLKPEGTSLLDLNGHGHSGRLPERSHCMSDDNGKSSAKENLVCYLILFAVLITGIFIATSFPYASIYNESWVADSNLLYWIAKGELSYKEFYTDPKYVTIEMSVPLYEPARLCLDYLARLIHNQEDATVFQQVFPMLTFLTLGFGLFSLSRWTTGKPFAGMIGILFCASSPGLFEYLGIEWTQDTGIQLVSFASLYAFIALMSNPGKRKIILALILMSTLGWLRRYVMLETYAAAFIVMALLLFNSNYRPSVRAILGFLTRHVYVLILALLFSFAWILIPLYYHGVPFYPHQVTILGHSFVGKDEYMRYLFHGRFIWPGSSFEKISRFFLSGYYFNPIETFAFAILTISMPFWKRKRDEWLAILVLIIYTSVTLIVLFLIQLELRSLKFILPLAGQLAFIGAWGTEKLVCWFSENSRRIRALGIAILLSSFASLAFGMLCNDNVAKEMCAKFLISSETACAVFAKVAPYIFICVAIAMFTVFVMLRIASRGGNVRIAQTLKGVIMTFLFIASMVNLLVFGGGKTRYSPLAVFRSRDRLATLYGDGNLQIFRYIREVLRKEGTQSVLFYLTNDFQTTSAALVNVGIPLWQYNYAGKRQNESFHLLKTRNEVLQWLKKNRIKYILSYYQEEDFERRLIRAFSDEKHPVMLGRLLKERDPAFRIVIYEKEHWRAFALYEAILPENL